MSERSELQRHGDDVTENEMSSPTELTDTDLRDPILPATDEVPWMRARSAPWRSTATPTDDRRHG